MKKIVDISHDILKEAVNKETAVDFTLGNGYDTLFFYENGFKNIYSFDIQKESLLSSYKLLSENHVDDKNIRLIHDGHEHMDLYVNSFDAGVFNFGYLPSSDEIVTTMLDTSVEAVHKALDRLNPKGILVLILYPGHSEGKKESHYFDTFVSKLPSKKYATCKIELPNKRNAPYIIVIEKN